MIGEEKPGVGDNPAGKVAAAGIAQPKNTAGILAMLVAMASFSSGDALMKLSSTSLPTGELVWLRATFVAIAAVLYAGLTGALRNAWRLLSPAIVLRAIGDVGSATTFQTALARMNLADAVAVIQANPLLVTAASAVFLGERVGWRRWTAAAVGLLGVLLIIRPGTSAFSWWSIFAIISVLFSTLRDVSTKSIDGATPAVLIILFSSTTVGLGGLSLGIFENWLWPDALVLLQVFGAAAFSLTGHVFIIAAVRKGELSAVAPFRYSVVIWALIFGFVIWGDLPDSLTLLGIVTVVGAGLYVFHRELIARRSKLQGGPS